MVGARLTQSLFDDWIVWGAGFVEFHRQGSEFAGIETPPERPDAELGVLSLPVDTLRKSQVYPYGLTQQKIDLLKRAGYSSIGDLAEADENALKRLESVGDVFAHRIKLVAYQAIWM